MADVVTSTVTLHGSTLTYLDTAAQPAGVRRVGRRGPDGDKPVVLFVHGLLGSHRHWTDLLVELSGDVRVVAPDLFGHGASAKPMGDYSLGAHAASLRDLLDALGIDRVTVVGHSLGGGVAMQFRYLFPERVEALVLVGSGGLGRELSPLLRAAVLPGAELVLPLLAAGWLRRAIAAVGGLTTRFGVTAPPNVAEVWRETATLGDAASRRAFLASARAVIDTGGQTVHAGRLFESVRSLPVLIVWGSADPIIPVAHAHATHEQLPASRLEVFDGAGHFPHLDDPLRFARSLRDFLTDHGTGAAADATLSGT